MNSIHLIISKKIYVRSIQIDENTVIRIKKRATYSLYWVKWYFYIDLSPCKHIILSKYILLTNFYIVSSNPGNTGVSLILQKRELVLQTGAHAVHLMATPHECCMSQLSIAVVTNSTGHTITKE